MKGSSRQRVIPNSYEVCELSLTGETPLLMESSEADPQTDLYRAYRSLATQRGRSEAESERLAELEWLVLVYFDDELGPFIPGKNVKELLRRAATKFRKGEIVKRSLLIPQFRIPLGYDGPRTTEALWREGFAYRALVGTSGPGGGRVWRTRPMFDPWHLTCELAFDPDELDFDSVCEIVERSQKYGLGGGRAIEMGAFSATVAPVTSVRGATRANGHKRADKAQAKALASSAKRMVKA